MRARSSPRPGYALMLTLVFVVLFLALLGVAYRQMAAALRTESVRSQQVERDEGSVHALARGLTLLETGLPPSTPYVCGVTIQTSTGPRSFTVTFVSEGGTNWSVRSTPTLPGENPPPMPSTFGPG
jgi:hypothetical protein